jgi:hypothetical protein
MVKLQSSVNGFNQVLAQNSSSGTSASSNFIVNNNLSTDTTGFGEFGINSSGFTGSGSFNAANAVYLASNGGDIVVGTTTAHSLRVCINSAVTDALIINSSNATFSTPLITAASASGGAGLRLPHGTDPTSPTNGDVWTTTAGMYVRISGTTVGPLGTGGGGGGVSLGLMFVGVTY